MTEVIMTKIAGISLHQNVIPGISPGAELMLEREKENKHDCNAIKILTKDGKQLGYVKRVLAFDLARVIDSGVIVKCFASMITGENHSTKGVNIEIRVGAVA